MTLRALVIDDQRLFAEAMQGVLERLGFAATVATSGVVGLSYERRDWPDLVLLTLPTRDSDGIDLGRKIREASPETTVIAVTAHVDPMLVTAAEEAGFLGIVPKDIPLAEFVNAVMSALEGRRPFLRSAPSERSLVKPRERDVELLAAQLTRREWQVLELLVEGRAGSDISKSLEIGPNTVRTHIQSVLTKLQVHSRLEAAGFAVRHGLVPPAAWEQSEVAS